MKKIGVDVQEVVLPDRFSVSFANINIYIEKFALIILCLQKYWQVQDQPFLYIFNFKAKIIS